MNIYAKTACWILVLIVLGAIVYVMTRTSPQPTVPREPKVEKQTPIVYPDYDGKG